MARNSSKHFAKDIQTLDEELEKTRRELAAAEKELKRKPKVKRSSPTPDSGKRINVDTAIELGPFPGNNLQGSNGGRRRERPPRRRGRGNMRMAQIKFILLCIILFAMGLYIWRNFPG